MVDRYVVDPEKDQDQTIIELAQKLNEVIEVISSQQVSLASRRPPVPGPAQHVEYLEMMAKRLETGPYAALEPNELTKAIGEALTKLQAAVEVYKASLAKE